MQVRYSGSKDSMGRMTQWPTTAEALANGLSRWDTCLPEYEPSTKSLLLDSADRLIYLRPEITDFNFEYNQAFSVVVWFKTSAGASMMPIAKRMSGGTYRGWDLICTGAAIQFWAINSAGVEMARSIGPAYDDGNWHQIVMAKGNTSAAANTNIYYDGALPAQTTLSDALGANTMVYPEAPLCLGARSTAPPSTGAVDNYTGNIGDIAIYDKKLTLAEVTATRPGNKLTDLSIVGPTANLVGWWRPGENPLPFLWDWSGNGNHAELWNIDSTMVVADVP